MLNNVENYLICFVKLDCLTQLLIIGIIIFILIILYKSLKLLLNFVIKVEFDFELFYKFLIKLIHILKNYELKTMAGLINVISTISLWSITLFSFVSENLLTQFFNLPNSGITIGIFLFLSIFMALISMLILYKFHSIINNIS